MADTINDALQRGKRVLVHCAAGMERSPTAVIFYLMKYKKMKLDVAYSLVKSVHPEMYDRRNWLSNAEIQLSQSFDEHGGRTRLQPL